MIMTPTPNRRWLRFSLRTLFVVVTVLACWLGWQLFVIRDRQAVKAHIEERGGLVVADNGIVDGYQFGDVEWIRQGYVNAYPTHPELEQKSMKIPGFRRILGDHAAIEIVMPSTFTRDELHRVRTTFPEANLVVDEPESSPSSSN